MKHILITGSTRGLGFAMAHELLSAGHRVTINGTCENSVNKALGKLSEEYNENVHGFVGDVSNIEAVEQLWEEGVKGFGLIDIWINNAGIDQPRKLFSEIEPGEYERVININILGVMNGSKVALCNMLKQGSGRIYNMEGFGSDGRKLAKMAVYGTSKNALNYFTQSLAIEVKNTNVKIGILSPGMMATDFLKNSLPKEPAEAARIKKFYNILADPPETVAEFLVERILKDNKNGSRIAWLTNGKAFLRFLKSPFVKRDLFK